MAEEAQHRHHAVDRIDQRRRRHEVARGERLAQRQQVEQELDQRARIAADVAAVGQGSGAPTRRPGAAWSTSAGRFWPAMHSAAKVERDHALQPRQPVARVAGGAAQIAHLPGAGCAGSGGRSARRRRAGGAAPGVSHEMMRRATMSGRQATASATPCSAIHSSTSARALARVMRDSAARRWRSQPKPNSASAHSSDGGSHLERRAAVADRRSCRRRRSGRHRSRSRGSGRRCAGPAARSAAGRSRPRQKRQRSSGCAFSRADADRSARRTTNQEQLGTSAINPRDMDRLSSPQPRLSEPRNTCRSWEPVRERHAHPTDLSECDDSTQSSLGIRLAP